MKTFELVSKRIVCMGILTSVSDWVRPSVRQGCTLECKTFRAYGLSPDRVCPLFPAGEGHGIRQRTY